MLFYVLPNPLIAGIACFGSLRSINAEPPWRKLKKYLEYLAYLSYSQIYNEIYVKPNHCDDIVHALMIRNKYNWYILELSNL
jgi:hypothetical protein